MYPLVHELAGDGIPVTVTCRVLKIARQPYYRWLKHPVTDRELADAHLANSIYDAHRDDPEFGYQFLADEIRDGGHTACDRTVWRHCAANGWWSRFGKRRPYKGAKPGVAAHEDLVHREFTATEPNRLWLTDITEHRTGEGKLYLCAIKDGPSRRGRRQRRHGIVLRAAPEERPRPSTLGRPRRSAPCDRHLDRTHLSPTAPPSPARPIDPHRVRGDHHTRRQPCGLTPHPTCHQITRQSQRHPRGSCMRTGRFLYVQVNDMCCSQEFTSLGSTAVGEQFIEPAKLSLLLSGESAMR